MYVYIYVYIYMYIYIYHNNISNIHIIYNIYILYTSDGKWNRYIHTSYKTSEIQVLGVQKNVSFCKTKTKLTSKIYYSATLWLLIIESLYNTKYWQNFHYPLTLRCWKMARHTYIFWSSGRCFGLFFGKLLCLDNLLPRDRQVFWENLFISFHSFTDKNTVNKSNH